MKFKAHFNYFVSILRYPKRMEEDEDQLITLDNRVQGSERIAQREAQDEAVAEAMLGQSYIRSIMIPKEYVGNTSGSSIKIEFDHPGDAETLYAVNYGFIVNNALEIVGYATLHHQDKDMGNEDAVKIADSYSRDISELTVPFEGSEVPLTAAISAWLIANDGELTQENHEALRAAITEHGLASEGFRIDVPARPKGNECPAALAALMLVNSGVEVVESELVEGLEVQTQHIGVNVDQLIAMAMGKDICPG